MRWWARAAVECSAVRCARPCERGHDPSFSRFPMLIPDECRRPRAAGIRAPRSARDRRQAVGSNRGCCYHRRAPLESERNRACGGCHGEEATGCGLQDRRSRRCQRQIVGGRGSQRGGNCRRVAARPARGRSNANGHEVGKRQGRRISHARVALLQIRSLRGFADPPVGARMERGLTIAREVSRHPLLAVAGDIETAALSSPEECLSCARTRCGLMPWRPTLSIHAGFRGLAAPLPAGAAGTRLTTLTYWNHTFSRFREGPWEGPGPSYFFLQTAHEPSIALPRPMTGRFWGSV